MKKENWKKIENICSMFLVLSVLTVCVYRLRFGIDVQDTSFYLTLYRYFFERGTGGNSLYYLLGEFFGSFIYHVFPTLYALNIAGLIVYGVIGYLVYRIMRPYLDAVPLALAVSGGIAFGASWVRCVNWNAWSMLFLSLGILFLLNGFDTHEKKWFYLAGLVLGVNVYVRMPNILFLGLIAAVFCYYMGEDTKTAFAFCGKMILGAITAGIAGAVFAVSVLGQKKFISDILCLMDSAGNRESKHNIADMIGRVSVGVTDGTHHWLECGLIIGIIILVCVLIRRFLKKDVTIFGIVIATAFALYSGFTLDVSNSSMPDLLSVQNFIAYGGMAFGILGAAIYYKSDKRFAVLCLMETLVMIFMTIGTDTGSVYFRIFMALPAGIIAAILMRTPLKELRILAMFVLVITFATGMNCNLNYIYHDGEYGEVMESTIDSPVFEGVYTTASRAEYVNRLIELLAPYEEKELITIGAFNIGHNVTDMKTFFNCAWTDLDYLMMEEFQSVLEDKLDVGSIPVVVIGTTKINGEYWEPYKVEILEELVQGELFDCIYSDEWYSVHVPAE